jgi:hypothetical protein
MIDMRYMWSEMDSPWSMPNLRQPSRLVVFRRSRRWKNGTGEDECFSSGVMVERTVSGVHFEPWLGARRPEVGSVRRVNDALETLHVTIKCERTGR